MIIKDFQKNVSLAKYTTFKIGGPAKYFYIAKTSKQIINAVKLTQELKISYFILGGGSNILISDRGFNGLAIKTESRKFKIIKNRIFAEAGAKLNDLINASIKNNLSGLEWAVGIPGTLGGAINGNAGAFGEAISDSVEEVAILRKGKKIKLKNKELKFGYRESLFKNNQDIILSAKLKLKKGERKKSKKIIKEYLEKRKAKQPLGFPSAGSIFKKISLKEFDGKIKELIIKERPEFKEFAPAGWLIEKCGLKGKKIREARISEKHSNFIINLSGAKAEEVIILISLIKQKIRNKFGVQLQEEIDYIGFDI